MLKTIRRYCILALLLCFALLLSACTDLNTLLAENEAPVEDDGVELITPALFAEAGTSFDKFVGEWVAEDSGEILLIEADGTISFRDLTARCLTVMDFSIDWVTPDDEYYKIKGREYFRLWLGSFDFSGGNLVYHRYETDLIPSEMLDSLPADGTVFRTTSEEALKEALYDLFIGEWIPIPGASDVSADGIKLTINADKSIVLNGVTGRIVSFEIDERLFIQCAADDTADPELFPFCEFEYFDGVLYYTPYDLSILSPDLAESIPNDHIPLIKAGNES